MKRFARALLGPLALLGAAATAAAQATAADAALLQQFQALTADRRDAALRSVTAQLTADADPGLERVRRLQRPLAGTPAADPAPYHAVAEFAPGAAARNLVAADTPAHRAATASMAPFRLLPELHAEVAYDWRRGTVALAGTPPDAERRFANLAAGLPPGADHAVARILAILDTDPEQRALAEFFEHLYADRDGHVFAGVSLYDAWSSGRKLEMPDADAVAFARKVLHTASLVAPLPEDRRRERIYRKVADAFASHREYRTLRSCLAATFVAAEPTVDPAYAPLLRRCHWLWAAVDHDPQRLAERLATHPDRASVLDEVDAALRADPAAAEPARLALRELGAKVRARAAQAIAAAGK